MPSVLESLRDRACSDQRRIIFPEVDDPRVVEAANQFQSLGFGQSVLLQRPQQGSLEPDVLVVSDNELKLRQAAIEQLIENRKHKGMDADRAEEAIKDPLLYASLLVRIGFADGSVAGSIATTASVIRAGIYGVGVAPEGKLVSSFFLMQFPDRAVTYADCGVVPDPSVDELAQIAICSAESHRILTGETPRVAMLSFSTKGSAEHPRVAKIRSALQLARQQEPDLLIDGELQFDAAYLPEVADRKAPESKVAGRANVFIFPDLDSGNIAYKITERLGGAVALGPLIQGLASPCMDLSRGCKVSDIVDVAVIASVMASQKQR